MKLGQKAICKVTGLKGVLVSKAEHLNGCNRWLIQPPVDKDGKLPEGYWMDEIQLEALNEPSVMEHKKVETGGPISRHS